MWTVVCGPTDTAHTCMGIPYGLLYVLPWIPLTCMHAWGTVHTKPHNQHLEYQIISLRQCVPSAFPVSGREGGRVSYNGRRVARLKACNHTIHT
jgi:hypothetical protein